ncbi:MAG: transglycosylase SLT domain-containing protein [Myxococcota bacterium]|nr:transglycosylase SLT domain-containing protein [Myxococcota bacterium]
MQNDVSETPGYRTDTSLRDAVGTQAPSTHNAPCRSTAYSLQTQGRPRFSQCLAALPLLAGLLLSPACQRMDGPTALGDSPEQPAPLVAAPPLPEDALALPSAPEPDPTQEQILEALSQRRTSLTKPELERLAQTIAEECERHDFEPELILAVIFVESGGRPAAVSHVGALGLMQIMPPTGAEVARKLGLPWEGPSTLLDPIVNVKLGVAYLRTLNDRYEDMSAALAAYNWGPGRIDRRLRRGQDLPTEYINRVIDLYGRQTGVATGRS